MPRTIIQTISFKGSPKVLFALYADSNKHAAATGAPARISTKVGGKWHSFEGGLYGRTLGVVRDRVIVQTWRAGDWTPGQEDSLLVLSFEKEGRGTRLTMIHANIPDQHYAGIKTGWTTYYWAPWRRYLASKKKS